MSDKLGRCTAMVVALTVTAVLAPALATAGPPVEAGPMDVPEILGIPLDLARASTSGLKYQFVRKWGTQGNANGEFSSPIGIDVDGSGNVYVADWGNYRIQKFNPAGVFRRKWGTYGTGNGQFDLAADVAIDSRLRAFVADTANDRIQKSRTSGVYRAKWGSSGSGEGRFNQPWGICAALNDRIYVVDRYNHRVQKFRSNGQFMRQWGSQGSANGQFESPTDVAVDSRGRVYVTDTGNLRVQRFSSSGTFQKSWAAYVCSGIDVGPDGRVYVTDTGNDYIWVYTPAGRYVSYFGTSGAGDGGFQIPERIVCDPNSNRIFITDSQLHRVTVFRRVDTTSNSADGGSGGAAISSLSAAPTNMGAQVTFMLSSAARVEARVLNIAGRPVKTICSGRECESGANTLVWNAMSDSGVRAPNGVYLIEVAARSEGGGEARALTRVRIGK